MENIAAKREIVIESGPIGRPYAKIILQERRNSPTDRRTRTPLSPGISAAESPIGGRIITNNVPSSDISLRVQTVIFQCWGVENQRSFSQYAEVIMLEVALYTCPQQGSIKASAAP